MSEYHKIIEKPLVTEKSMQMLHETNRVSFQVNQGANKHQVKKAIEKIFGVTVEAVNVMVVRGKSRRFGKNIGFTGNWKKAIVKLKEGDKIELFEGM
tara:strand:+ start:446 stop:736 length:291 start_codon:yes stop_codon:yes gene_type:complete